MKTAAAMTALLLCLFITAPARAQDEIVIGGLDGLDIDGAPVRYPVLLALSGGGARGLAAIGVLKAFEEKHIVVVGIAGTSIGGIVGGLYACGHSPDDLANIVRSTDFSGLFSNQPARQTMFMTQREDRDRHLLSVRFDRFTPVLPRALTAGQKLTSLLTTLTTRACYHAGGDFDRLPIPFRAISTDIITGEEVVLDSGSLANAMRATMGFPLAFTPLEEDGQLLMDGGMVIPIPVELVRTMSDSVSFVVAVNTASPLLPREGLTNAMDIASQVTSIMTADKLARQMEAADYALTPPLSEFGMGDFDDKDSLIESGYRAGLVAADSIVSLLSRETDTSQFCVVEIVCDSLASPLGEVLEERLLGRTICRSELVAVLRSLAEDYPLFRLAATSTTVCSTSVIDREVALGVASQPMLSSRDTQFRFVGNRVFDDSSLAAEVRPADPLISVAGLRAGLQRVLDLYRDRGYDLTAVVDVEIDPVAEAITVTLDEASMTRVDVEGNERTRSWIITSNFPHRVGEPYSTRRASRGLANIYGTGLFERVTIDLSARDSGAAVTIGVEENQYQQLRMGWHWDDEFRSEEFAEFLDDNVFGIGLQYLIHGRYAPDRQAAYGGLKIDRIFSTYLTARARLYHERMVRDLYNIEGDVIDDRSERRTGFELHLGQQISRLGTASAGIVLEEVRAVKDGQTTERFDLRVIRLQSLVETFDRVNFPESGKRHLFELELAGRYLGGDVEFTRYYSSVEAYWSLAEYATYHPRLEVGLSRSGLPISEKFYLGGLHSFAGFSTHQLPGDKVLSLTNEVRFRLPSRLFLSLRYDIGDAITSADEWKLSGLRHGVCVIGAFDSPIGPFELGYGVADGGYERYYINVGLRF